MKKKIAVIGVKGLPGFGGGARSTESLLNEIKGDYAITVYSIDSHTALSGDYNGIRQITFKSLPFKRLNTIVYYFKSLIHCLFIGRYDLVHVQHIYAGFIIPLLRLRYPVINTVRGIIPRDDNKWNSIDKIFFRLFEFLALKFSTVSVSVCQPHIAYLQGIVNRPVYYIPNGVYVYQALIDQKIDEDYLCFSAGRIIGLKGCHLLLAALHLIDYKGKLKIIGSIDHVNTYGNTIKEMAAGLDVEFLGLIKEKDNLFKIVANARLFIFPSLNEGMSNMLLEAASLKTPIISSDIVENKFIFNDNEVLYFKSDDVNDLSVKIRLALADPVMMQKKRNLAYEKISGGHDWKNIAITYKKIYEEII